MVYIGLELRPERQVFSTQLICYGIVDDDIDDELDDEEGEGEEDFEGEDEVNISGELHN